MEELGSDEDTALLNLVPHRFAEYASGCIDALECVDSSQADPLVRQDLADQRIAGA
jgi:hypothetical protein